MGVKYSLQMRAALAWLAILDVYSYGETIEQETTPLKSSNET